MKYLIALLAFSFKFTFTFSQSPITLPAYIELAKANSPQSKLAHTQKEISLYQYQSFLSDLKPQITFYGNVPAYSKDFFDVRQPDGTIKFLPRKQNFSNIGFSLSQQVLATGGTLSLRTDFSRFDDFSLKSKSYSSTPVYVRLDQPLFGFNYLKWNKKIEPLKLIEANKSEIFNLQKIASQICSYYFQVLESEVQLQIALSNINSIQEIADIEQKRILLGTTSEEKILQLQLQKIQAKQKADQARYDVQISVLKLNTVAGLNNTTISKFVLPEELPLLTVSLDTAIYYAKKQRPEFIAFQRTSLESERDVLAADAAKKKVNLVASYGYNNAANSFGSLYDNTLNQQRMSIGFDIPLVDWGRRDARLRTFKAIQSLNQFNNELSEQALIQEVTTVVNTLELLIANIETAKETQVIAQKRFQLSTQTYQTSKTTLTELNIARQEQNQADLNYIQALKSYWIAYYQLRELTLYDFELHEEILK